MFLTTFAQNKIFMEISSSYVTFTSLSKTSFANYAAKNIAILVDNNTYQHCYLSIKHIFPPHHLICIEAGEEHKNLKTCEYIWSQLTEFQFDRKSLLINLGGGVIGDMGGFCAATYKRGIDFIQIPTTLLSQVDASVGGKLGIDFQGYKNHIGVFALPQEVLIDVNFLQTLSVRELKSGFAEVIKHCLIADKNEWKKISQLDFQHFSYQSFDWSAIVQHSIAIKDAITTQDPTEKGLRKTLNFGHTIGHAIESFFLTTPNPLLHGEAITLGIIAESYLSWKRNLLAEQDYLTIRKFIYALYQKPDFEVDILTTIANLALQDKKNEQGKVFSCLLHGIGNCVYHQELSIAEIKESLVTL